MFDKIAHKNRMKSETDKLVSYFKKQKVEFIEQDPDGFENVIFKSSTREIKIAHHSFYRYSGIAVFTKSNDKNESEVFPVTNEMYMC